MLVFFEIIKYTFLIFEKGTSKKIDLGFFKVCKYTFLIFEKADKQKNCAMCLEDP